MQEDTTSKRDNQPEDSVCNDIPDDVEDETSESGMNPETYEDSALNL